MTYHAPPWLAAYPLEPLEIFDPDLAEDACHPKRYAWLTREKVEHLQAPDTSVESRPTSRMEKWLWFGFFALYAISAWWTLVDRGADAPPLRRGETVHITLAPTNAKTPAPTPEAQPIAETSIAPIPKRPAPAPKTPRRARAPVQPEPQPQRLTIPKPTPRAAPSATPLRQGTTVFDPRLRQRLESAEVAGINTRTQRPEVQHFWRSHTTEVYGCQRILHDPVIGEMWIIGNAGGCQPQKKVRRFGRRIEADN